MAVLYDLFLRKKSRIQELINSPQKKNRDVTYYVLHKTSLINPASIDFLGFIEVDDGQIYVNYDDWKSLATFYVGLLVLVAIMIVFAVFMPVCGLCFCCCRCCGNCGARSKPFDKKGDLCKKIILATLLIVLGTLLL